MGEEKKLNELFIFTHKIGGDSYGPFATIFENAEDADYAVNMSKRSNNPTVLRVIDKTEYENISLELSKSRELVGRLEETLKFYTTDFNLFIGRQENGGIAIYECKDETPYGTKARAALELIGGKKNEND